MDSVTVLLRRWRQGDEAALSALLPLVYDQLHTLAARQMSRERGEHTLGITGLLHEAYLRLVDAEVDWQDRAHFFAIASRTMRRVLVDYARSAKRAKRGAGAFRTTLEEGLILDEHSPDRLIAIDAALSRLAEQDARKADAVELCFFGGLTQVEAAEVLNISLATVERELRVAKAWLHRELAG